MFSTILKDKSSFRLNSLGPLCLWQCFVVERFEGFQGWWITFHHTSQKQNLVLFRTFFLRFVFLFADQSPQSGDREKRRNTFDWTFHSQKRSPTDWTVNLIFKSVQNSFSNIARVLICPTPMLIQHCWRAPVHLIHPDQPPYQETVQQLCKRFHSFRIIIADALRCREIFSLFRSVWQIWASYCTVHCGTEGKRNELLTFCKTLAILVPVTLWWKYQKYFSRVWSSFTWRQTSKRQGHYFEL